MDRYHVRALLKQDRPRRTGENGQRGQEHPGQLVRERDDTHERVSVFLGKLEWVAGIIPRLRWTVSSMYAVLTNVLHQEDKEVERAKQRTGDKRPKLGLVATKRLAQQCPG